MFTIVAETVTAPVYWASALVNGDESSFDHPSSNPADRAAYDRLVAWLKENNLSIVGTTDDEPRFTWHGLLYWSAVPGCEVVDYIALRVRS